VLGMPQSGKTTLLKTLRGERTSGRYVATHSTQTLEHYKVKFENDEITLGKTKDIPGDFDQQISALNNDVKDFFKEKNGLILYIINCNDLNSEKLVDYSSKILRKAFDAYEKAKVAIIYSHPDETKVDENDLNKIHKHFCDKLVEAEFYTTAEKFFNSKHYMINLVGKDVKKHLEKVFKDCE
jgi:ribosome biogenesis GTPase A